MDYRDKLTPKPVVHFYAAAPAHIPAAVDTMAFESADDVAEHLPRFIDSYNERRLTRLSNT